jgi:Rieske Fe-S protein
MGCLVSFNDAERSWDCPCHGSRFTIDGELLEGPAVDDLAAKQVG